MIDLKIKLWRSASAAALISVAACGQPAEAPPEALPSVGAESGEAAIGESGGEHGEAGVSAAYAGISGDQRTALRLQHLKGFLMIAERTAEAGAPAEASVLIGQGLLEVFDPASDQFGTLNVAPVRAVAEAPDVSGAELARRIEQGEAAIDSARAPLEANYADLAVRMTDISAGLYQHVVQADFVDPIEYQHSLGAALSARDALAAGRDQLRSRNAAAYDEAMAELGRYIELWPSVTAPDAVSGAASYQQVLQHSSRVRLALSAFL